MSETLQVLRSIKMFLVFRTITRRQEKKSFSKILKSRGIKTAVAAVETRPNVEDDIFSHENVTFGNMSALEIIRAITVLGLCSLPGFADNATQILKITKKFLGRRLFSRVMRWTAYGQFVAGDEVAEIQRTAEKLRQCNLLQMLAVPIEDENDGTELSGDELYDHNTTRVLSCVDITRDTRSSSDTSLMQVKLTAVIDYRALFEVSSALQKNTISYSELAQWMEKGCKEAELASLLPTLPAKQIADFASGVLRLLLLIDHAKANDVKILVDAEYTWINSALQYISIALMRLYNKEKSVVFKTYQAYLKETRELLRAHAKECEEAGVHFGLKLVRGAYLVPETKKCGSHPPYMCDSWEATNENYDACIRDALELDQERTEIVFATHNEQSVRLAAELLHERRMKAGTSRSLSISNISFAQLYGMADYMSFTLGKMGYKVFKSVPYGTVNDTLPYLCRRAKENTLFLRGIRKEMDMLKIALAFKVKRTFVRD